MPELLLDMHREAETSDWKLTPVDLATGHELAELAESLVPDLEVTIDLTTLVPPSVWASATPGVDVSWTLVLSGGGAKGAFQVGAMQNLQRLGYWPRGIAATSVGAVNALGFAERSWAGLDKVAQLWLSMNSPLDVYTPEPWLREVDRLETLRPNIVRRLVGGQPRSLDPSPGLGLAATIDGLLNDVAGTLSLAAYGLVALLPAVPFIGIFGLPWARDAIEDYRRDLTRLNAILSREARGLFRFDPLVERMRTSVDPEAIAAAGMQLRLVMVSLDRQSVCAVDEHGELWEYAWQQRALTTNRANRYSTAARTVEAGPLIRAATASAAVPILNSPVLLPSRDGLLGDHMVDGGVRQILPVDQGLEMNEERTAGSRRKGLIAIGAGAVHPRAASLPELSTEFSIGEYGFFDIGVTSFMTALDEINADELARIARLPDDLDRLVVMPALPVGGLTEMDPGLVQILLAYGWMRAFDAHSAARLDMDDQDYVNFYWWPTERIIELRLAVWRLEREARSIPLEHASALAAAVAVAGARGLSGEGGDAAARAQAFVDNLPVEEIFPLTARIGRQSFGSPGPDLIERIRQLKRDIHTAVRHRVKWHGLDSIPSTHELSNHAVGNGNAYVDWWGAWERHAVAAMGFPTGPGLVDTARRRAEEFRHRGSPWAEVGRYSFGASGATGVSVVVDGLDLARMEVTKTPATDPPPDNWCLRTPDYSLVRLEGYILQTPRDGMTVPLRTAFSPDENNNVTTTSTALRAGFRPAEVLGHVFPTGRGTSAAGLVPLFSFRSPSRQDDLVTSDRRRFATEDDKTTGRAVLPPDYGFVRVEALVFDPDEPQPDGTLPLYRWYSPSRTDFATTSHASWRPVVDGEPVLNTRDFDPRA